MECGSPLPLFNHLEGTLPAQNPSPGFAGDHQSAPDAFDLERALLPRKLSNFAVRRDSLPSNRLITGKYRVGKVTADLHRVPWRRETAKKAWGVLECRMSTI
jgi:hypothetical protein